MPKTAAAVANPYDHPKYYDLVFGGHWREEVRFLCGAFKKYAQRPVKRIFEPACGSGRLLVRLGRKGFHVGGNDLSPAAIEYCNQHLATAGVRGRATVGDMSDFRLKKPCDAAFNLINSFRHLPTEAAAVSHLRCVTDALAPDGIYLLGLHLTPTKGRPLVTERWTGERRNLRVTGVIETERVDLRNRAEHIRMTFTVTDKGRRHSFIHRCIFRTYTAPQLRRLIATATNLDWIASHDFNYDLEEQQEATAATQDVVLVLRKK